MGQFLWHFTFFCRQKWPKNLHKFWIHLPTPLHVPYTWHNDPFWRSTTEDLVRSSQALALSRTNKNFVFVFVLAHEQPINISLSITHSKLLCRKCVGWKIPQCSIWFKLKTYAVIHIFTEQDSLCSLIRRWFKKAVLKNRRGSGHDEGQCVASADSKRHAPSSL